MSLIKCPECGKEISDTTDVCIHCGYVLNDRYTKSEEKHRIKKSSVIVVIVVILIVILIGGFFYYKKVFIPNKNYNKAVETLEKGDYDSAIIMFTMMEDFKDSREKIDEAHYKKGIMYLNGKDYENARTEFSTSNGYSDSKSQIESINKILEEKRKKEEAEAAHKALIDTLQKAYKGCLGGQAKLSSDGTELMIDSTNQYDYLSLLDIQSVVTALGLPSTLFDQMTRTNALMGKQTQKYEKYEVSWSYHPNNGLDVFFKIVD